MERDNKTVMKITQSIIANQIAFDFNHEIKHTVYFKHRLKKILNQLIPELEKAEKNEFDQFFDEQENITDELYDVQREMTRQLSTLGLMHFQNVSEIIQAYKKDPKSIQGIVNKINKKH